MLSRFHLRRLQGRSHSYKNEEEGKMRTRSLGDGSPRAGSMDRTPVEDWADLSFASAGLLAPAGLPLPSLPLELGPLNSARGSVSSPSGVWGGAPAEVRIWCILALKSDIW